KPSSAVSNLNHAERDTAANRNWQTVNHQSRKANEQIHSLHRTLGQSTPFAVALYNLIFFGDYKWLQRICASAPPDLGAHLSSKNRKVIARELQAHHHH